MDAGTPNIHFLCAAAVLLWTATALAQSAPLDNRTQLKELIQRSAKTLRENRSPDTHIVGTRYLGLLRDGKPVGYEIFTTEIVNHDGRKAYRFADRALFKAPDGNTVTVDSTGLSAPSFEGIETTIRLTVSGRPEAGLAVRAKRIGKTVRIVSENRNDDKPLLVRPDNQVLALSGELQRLLQSRKWKPNDRCALWHLDAINGELSPVVLRALKNDRNELAGRKLGPLKIETWFADEGPDATLSLNHTTYLDRDGNVTLIVKSDGLVKRALSENEFNKNWKDRVGQAR